MPVRDQAGRRGGFGDAQEPLNAVSISRSAAFSLTVALATAAGPLIEVPMVLTLARIATRTEKGLFGTSVHETDQLVAKPEAQGT